VAGKYELNGKVWGKRKSPNIGPLLIWRKRTGVEPAYDVIAMHYCYNYMIF